MKKITVLLIASVLALTACGASSDPLPEIEPVEVSLDDTRSTDNSDTTESAESESSDTKTIKTKELSLSTDTAQNTITLLISENIDGEVTVSFAGTFGDDWLMCANILLASSYISGLKNVPDIKTFTYFSSPDYSISSLGYFEKQNGENKPSSADAVLQAIYDDFFNQFAGDMDGTLSAIDEMEAFYEDFFADTYPVSVNDPFDPFRAGSQSNAIEETQSDISPAYEDENIVISYAGLSQKSKYQPNSYCVNISVENKTDVSIELYSKDEAINDYMVTASGFVTILPGKSAIFQLQISEQDCERIPMSEIKNIDLVMYYYLDPDGNKSDRIYTDMFTLLSEE